MSAFAYVKQHFSAEGLNQFREIFPEHRRRAAQYEGFVCLRHLVPVGESEPSEVVTLLEFTDLSRLLKWRGSKDHAWIAEAYGKWWLKAPEMLLYSSED